MSLTLHVCQRRYSRYGSESPEPISDPRGFFLIRVERLVSVIHAEILSGSFTPLPLIFPVLSIFEALRLIG